MTYEEAEILSYKVPWKSSTCHVGEMCWCRTIIAETPIMYQDIKSNLDDEYYIIGDASIDKKLAEYIVKLHNDNLKTQTCVKNI